MVGRYALEFQCFDQPKLLWDKTHCVDIEKQVKNAQQRNCSMLAPVPRQLVMTATLSAMMQP